MTEKEKAIEIVTKFREQYKFSYQLGKIGALICVDEILDFQINKMGWSLEHNGNIHFWGEVKQEIEKL